ncbi:MAG: MATE family efflux transporter, partial [Clostridia bacterium]|nr:MATE family efflux transporter [Clostridia bacterium]
MARADLTQGNIKKTIIRLTLPMILGIFGMVAFNFADTAFVAQLGGTQLAALSFTFPVVMIIQSISMGLGMGAGSVISRVAKKKDSVKRLAT